MTKVLYERKKHRLTLKGHAGADVKGRDIVCAAMSILAYTYAQSALNAALNGFAKPDSVVTKFEEGDVEVSVTPFKKYDAMVTTVTDNIVLGYSLLAARYADNLIFEVRE